MGLEQPASRASTCCLDAGSEMGRQGAWDLFWGLRPRDWGSLAEGPATHFFFHLVQVVLVPLGAADLKGDGW